MKTIRKLPFLQKNKQKIKTFFLQISSENRNSRMCVFEEEEPVEEQRMQREALMGRLINRERNGA